MEQCPDHGDHVQDPSPLRQSLALLQRIARRIIPLAVAVAADLTQPRSSVHAHGAGVCVIWYGIIPYPVPCHACINACCMVTVRYCCCFSSASAHQQLIIVPVVLWGGDSNTGAELVQCNSLDHRHAAYICILLPRWTTQTRALLILSDRQKAKRCRSRSTTRTANCRKPLASRIDAVESPVCSPTTDG